MNRHMQSLLHIARTAGTHGRVLWAVLLCAALCLRPAAAEELGDPPSIRIVPQEGFNLSVEEQIASHYLVVTVDPPVHNWFAGTFADLPTDGEVTIGLTMVGMDTPGNRGDVRKWAGLRPVMTYADPTQYESYEWFTKDNQGRWVSGDPFKHDDARFAGTGLTPEQSVIPADLAEEFLSPDGTYWQPWREVDSAEAVTTLNIFRMKQRFAQPTATVAMRVPYTYTYLQLYNDRLQKQNNRHVFLDNIGTTPQGRAIQVIRVEDLDNDIRDIDRKTVLIIAREHATEPASSWVLQGMLNAVIAPDRGECRLRESTTWLFIPIQDPDGSAGGIFDRTTDWFRKPNDSRTPPEVFIYARYMADYINTGRTIDIAVSLHNIEANEGPHILTPFINRSNTSVVFKFNTTLFDSLRDSNYLVGDPTKPWNFGYISNRLFGWCNAYFGTLDIAFEVNDRWPLDRLSKKRVSMLGEALADHIGKWLISAEGSEWHANVREALSLRDIRRNAYFRNSNANNRTLVQTLSLGY